MHLTEIMPNTDAASVPGLRVGQLMLKVNGRSILGAKNAFDEPFLY